MLERFTLGRICRSNIVLSVLQVLHEECRSPGRVELCNALLYYGNNASNGRYIMRLLIALNILKVSCPLSKSQAHGVRVSCQTPLATAAYLPHP